MTLLLIALLIAFAAATAVVLADSGLRLWSAFGGIRAQQAMLRNNSGLPALRDQCTARVVTRVNYARPAMTKVSSSGLCQPVNQSGRQHAAA